LLASFESENKRDYQCKWAWIKGTATLDLDLEMMDRELRGLT
jgi:hypothetical protein